MLPHKHRIKLSKYTNCKAKEDMYQNVCITEVKCTRCVLECKKNWAWCQQIPWELIPWELILTKTCFKTSVQTVIYKYISLISSYVRMRFLPLYIYIFFLFWSVSLMQKHLRGYFPTASLWPLSVCSLLDFLSVVIMSDLFNFVFVVTKTFVYSKGVLVNWTNEKPCS